MGRMVAAKNHLYTASRVTYYEERWEDIVEELSGLWDDHWAEVAVDKDIPLSPDVDTYEELSRSHMLQCVMVRSKATTQLVGYHISVIRPHLHYVDSISGITDVYFLVPAWRKGTIGLRLFQLVEDLWVAKGVERAFTGTKMHAAPNGRQLDISKLLQRLGWVETERLYTKRLLKERGTSWSLQQQG